MQIRKNGSGENLNYALSGKFTFSDHQQFRSVIKSMSDSAKVVDLDFSDVEFVDSAALGMLLVAKEEAEKEEVTLTISNTKGQVERMFELSNFSSLFNMTN